MTSLRRGFWVMKVIYRSCLPVRLVGGDEAGHVAQDATTTLDDGERVGVAAMSQSSHKKGKSAINSTDVGLVLCAVS